MSEATPEIFVSYSRADEASARMVIDFLQAQGFSVWWDGMLEAGTVFTRTTEQALEQAKAVVVLWTSTSVDSHWVRDEAQSGRESGRLIPVSLDGTLPPLGFRQFQSVDLSGWRGSPEAPEIRNVRDAVARLVVTVSTPQPGAPKRTYRSPAKGRTRFPVVLAGIVLLLAAIFAFAWFNRGTGSDSEQPSLAILPFDNLSGDAEQAYFSNGLSEELRQVLSQDAQLQVAARTSSEEASRGNAGASEIASLLGVGYLLGGSVRKAGDQVRVSVQLIDGATGFDVWSEVYERSLDDIFAVQSDIAQRVGMALELHVGEDTAIRSRQGGTDNPVALDAYLRGKALYDLALDEETDRAALRQFKAAVEADPLYGAAWAMLSRTQTLIANSYPSEAPLTQSYAEAVETARRAVEVAPDLAAARAALGFVLFNGRLDATAAQEPMMEAYRLGQGDADILQLYATYAARTGDFESAQQAIERAIRLDPLNAVARRTQATIYASTGDFAKARSAAAEALRLNPDMRVVHRILGDMHYLEGNYAEAAAEFEAEGSMLSRLPGLAMTLPKLGDTAGGQRAFEQLEREYGLNGFYQQAQVLAQTGRSAQAMDTLEQAYSVNDAGLVLLRYDPLFEDLHDEPRFVALLRRMGFTAPD
ncbi:TIR domain-containing protein [Aurantiacibacter hainanensis]|uniref:TIR domain-containing protein n=1 Tax=Aurantiacibacter hainanensis TaxID=3076114 RepID=UPI0030C7038B